MIRITRLKALTVASLLVQLCYITKVEAQKIEVLQQGKPCSIRGLSVVNNKTAWASGSKGFVSITTDAGKSWIWRQVAGFEQADFRDIEAFSDKDAIIMSSGTPALILKTEDGGLSWQLNYRNDNKAYFLDAMAFFNKRNGVILGDPIENKFLLLKTNDGGKTWHQSENSPQAKSGEAAFAASGTCLRVFSRSEKIVLISGGSISEELEIEKGKTWSYQRLMLAQGKESKGGFSMASGGGYNVFVGGDYQNDQTKDSVVCYEKVGATDIQVVDAKRSPSGFQSSVEYLSGKTFISTGTSGSNITNDGGTTWTKIDDRSFNVCVKAKHGNLILFAGNNGRIGIFKN